MPKQFFFNLGLTFLLEFPIYRIFLRKVSFLQLLLFAFLLNAFTLPLATAAFVDWGFNYFLVEMSVVAVESLLFWKIWRFSFTKAFLIALLANFISALAGLLLAEGSFRIILS